MAGTIPFSNPAGNNQTNSSPILSGSAESSSGSTQIPGAPQDPGSLTVKDNAYATSAQATSSSSTSSSSSGTVPSTTQTTSSTGATSNTSAQNGFITNNSSYSNGENDLQKQLIDIYGKGTGGSLYSLLNSMSGTNSTILQEYIQSLAPQEAKASADVSATLGAGGVSANSSVNAIAQSNLKAQETAAIASESASLTQSQEQLTAEILTGMEGSSAKEVATSGWDVFGQVMNSIGGTAGSVIGDIIGMG